MERDSSGSMYRPYLAAEVDTQCNTSRRACEEKVMYKMIQVDDAVVQLRGSIHS